MDLRTIRTRQAIKDAFLKLRKKKAIEKITIQEIADIAMINKSTFYRHFEDIYQLSDEVENEVIDKCLENAGSTDIRDVFQGFIDNIEVYNTVFSGSRKSEAINKLHEKYMAILLKAHPEVNDNLEKKVILSSVIFGNFKAVAYYEKEDRETVIRGIQKLSDMLNGVVFD